MILGIDQGTTGTTAVLFDHELEPVTRGYSKVERVHPRPGWVEIAPDQLLDSVTTAVEAALEAGSVAPSEVSVVGLANQGETALCWDERGTPLANAIVWQDDRTAARCESIRADEELAAYVTETTGLPVDSYFSATKLEWILTHEADAHRGPVYGGTTDTWLLWRLASDRPYVTDHTTAARTMLFDIRELDWDDRLLAEFGLDEIPLPTPVPCDEVVGTTAPERLGGVEAPIAGCIVDQESSLYGQGCHAPGETKCTYGTGSFLVTNVGPDPVLDAGGLIPVVAWTLGGETHYALEGGIFTAGALVDWLVDDLGLLDAAEESDAYASSVSGTDGVYFVPALTGLAAPYWDRRCRGSLLGLDASTTTAHIVRAALEGIANRVRDVVDEMDDALATAVESIKVDGGLTANDFLLQYQADVLDRPIDVSAVTESTALGTAAIAGQAVGLDLDPARLGETSHRIRPSASAGAAGRSYDRWRRAVDLTRRWQPGADAA